MTLTALTNVGTNNRTLRLKSGKEAPFSLSESAQYDYESGASEKHTAWGMFCKQRHEELKAKR